MSTISQIGPKPKRAERALAALAITPLLVLGIDVVATPAIAAPAAPAPAAITGATMAAAPEGTTYEVPSKDPFYANPKGLKDYANGAIIRSRQIAAEINEYGRDVPIKSWQVAYRSNNAQGRPITSVTTILVPEAAWTGAGPRPLIAYQSAEDSTGSQCAPSYTLATNSPLLTGQEEGYLGIALRRGFAMAIADHEGPQSAYLTGPQAAHIVLDGVRAAQHFQAAGISTKTPVGLWGLSGGGFDTAWAAEMQSTYAPDLKIAGTAFGGAPVNLANTLKNLNGGPFVGFAVGAVVGLAHGYPGWDLYGQLNAKGREVYAAVDQKCTADFVVKVAFTDINRLIDGGNVIDIPVNASILRRNQLGQRTPVAPMFDYYAVFDQAVSVEDTKSLVNRYCAGGTQVVTKPFYLAEHVLLGSQGAPSAVDFLADRFAGRPLQGACQ